MKEVGDELFSAFCWDDFEARFGFMWVGRREFEGVWVWNVANFLGCEEVFEGGHDGAVGGNLGVEEVEVVPIWDGDALADIEEVWTCAHGTEEYAFLEDVVAGDGLTFTPAAFVIGAEAFSADLLGMAVDAAEFDVLLTTLLGDTWEFARVRIFTFFECDGLEVTNLYLGREDEACERGEDGEEDADE